MKVFNDYQYINNYDKYTDGTGMACTLGDSHLRKCDNILLGK